MKKQIKHGSGFVNPKDDLIKLIYKQKKYNAFNHKVIRLLFFIMGVAVGVLIMTS